MWKCGNKKRHAPLVKQYCWTKHFLHNVPHKTIKPLMGRMWVTDGPCAARGSRVWHPCIFISLNFKVSFRTNDANKLLWWTRLETECCWEIWSMAPFSREKCAFALLTCWNIFSIATESSEKWYITWIPHLTLPKLVSVCRNLCKNSTKDRKY